MNASTLAEAGRRIDAVTTPLPRTPDLHETDPARMRRALREYFTSTFDRYESLFQTLAVDAAWYEPAITLRHPLVFYYGHTATFFVNKLLLTRMIEERVDPHLESVFAVGVDEMGWDDLNDAHYEWPSVAEVQAYRDKVRALVLRQIDEAPLSLPIAWDHPWWAIVMGIEHERIHLETSSVLIRQHKLAYVKPHSAWQPCTQTGEAPQNTLVKVPAGKVVLGRGIASAIYGWDNEYGSHETEVPAFEASRMLVSNREFLAFVEAGGYTQSGYWEDEGNGWREFAKADHPTFWRRSDEGWLLRLMTAEVPMPWDWPVEVNYHEAKAFCRWKSAHSGQPVRLPTEDEWYRLYAESRRGVPDGETPDANLNLAHWASSCPVNHFAQGEFFDVAGNAWQWTETPIYPFEGFQVHPIYDDFSTPTFDGRHNLMKGGSWIATGNEAEAASRYAFRRHFFQHAGFRYVISKHLKPAPASHYETDKLLSEYAEFHYGDSYFGVPNFPQALAELAITALGNAPKRTALDLGCASGRATFELARHFGRVTGVDFSARFIGQGVALARGDSLRYLLADEGELVEYKSRNLAELGLADTVAKVEFFQGDACNLKPQFTGYDFILAANLIDRLYNPAQFLEAIHERLNPGGILMITSPYTWLAEHTPRADWVGGFKKDGESFTTLDGLDAILGKYFERLGEPRAVPFVIRETRRKFQHTLSEVTLWRRRA
ncbi:5-histidylcysteine sulfoxide synthase [Rhodanobacter sp. C06]|uniref:5-histidylcysteine sulfoxide synthase n=1 Tax=Rhodanobacter sp. C06 TaxID=1945854 RepID=UPI0020C45AB8|nr:5-histidylcysteine sulfoxide synthase [Rhodanobacter sp. C06]